MGDKITISKLDELYRKGVITAQEASYRMIERLPEDIGSIIQHIHPDILEEMKGWIERTADENWTKLRIFYLGMPLKSQEETDCEIEILKNGTTRLREYLNQQGQLS